MNTTTGRFMLLVALPLLLTGMAPRDERLIEAADKGDDNAVVEFLKEGAHVDAAVQDGKTPLDYANATDRHRELVMQLLVAKGAKVGANAHSGKRP